MWIAERAKSSILIAMTASCPYKVQLTMEILFCQWI